MWTFEEPVLGGNPFQQSGFGPNPEPEPNPEFGTVANPRCMLSVSNGSNPLERFRVRVGTGTEPLQRLYHMKNPDRCIWAGFHLKTHHL